MPQRLSNAKGRTHEWSWARTNPDLHRSLVNRLGNLVILDSDVNRSVESHEFGVKQTGTFKNAKGKISTIKCYKDTALPSAQALSNQTEWKGWTSAEIEQRQKDMAKAAIKVWAL
ncbi:MAG: HNH endonuclease family protein [Ferrovibrio sp.]|uniref:HNH endonuclease family protein n=1 Tax=Ferrovibrio sp. TaxID=1917215 RepID=UPI00391DA3D4